MILPTVKRNTYVKSEGKIYVDIVSKVYIYCQLALGVNRYPIIGDKRIFIALFYVYSIAMNIFVCYSSFITPYVNNLLVPVRTSRLILYELTFVVSLIQWKRYHYFYKEIEKFDDEVGCRPKFTRKSMIQMILFGILTLVICVLFPQYNNFSVVLYITSSLDYFYFSHLISLISTRVRLLNYYLECFNSMAKTDSSPDVSEFAFFEHYSCSNVPNMVKIMDLYQMIIIAHKYLVDAVKWLVSYESTQ